MKSGNQTAQKRVLGSALTASLGLLGINQLLGGGG
jgi:hypothetical protein